MQNINNEIKEEELILVCALLIHAAKMDENYSNVEKTIITKALREISNKDENSIKIIIEAAEKKENNANQILEFTKVIKKYEKNFRIKILEILWKIIYSDGILDMYESSLMRRLSGLLYVTDKENGEIKKTILKKIE